MKENKTKILLRRYSGPLLEKLCKQKYLIYLKILKEKKTYLKYFHRIFSKFFVS